MDTLIQLPSFSYTELEMREYITQNIVNKTDKSASNYRLFYKLYQNELEKIIMNGNTIREKMYIFYYNIQPHLCENCGKNYTEFLNFKDGYRKFCSRHCSQINNKTIEKRNKSKVKKYNNDINLMNDEINKKRKQSNIKKYGTPFAARNKEIKNKTEKYFLNKYGVRNPYQREFIREKAKTTSLQKYGVDSILKSTEWKKKTTMKKYGVENISQLEEIKQKKAQTHFEKFGVMWPNQNPSTHKKIMSGFGQKMKMKKYDSKFGTIHYQTIPELKFIIFCESKNIYVKNGPRLSY